MSLSVACRLAILASINLFPPMAAASGGSPAAGNWRYESSAVGVASIARSISLSAERPDDLAEEANYRGRQRRYAQLRYGSANSRRVIIVVDHVSGGVYDFYVDADRDRVVTDDERLAGEGRARTLPLDAEIIDAETPRQAPREVSLRLGAARSRLAVATLGCIVGEATLADDATLSIRRVDGDANGLFTDARDRFQVDVDRDGRWDPITEQFAYRPVQVIGDQRYAVRSDRFGASLSLSEITGVGQLSVALADLPPAARVIGFEAMVFSEDGSAYALRRLGESLSAPVGRYALGSVTLTIDPGEVPGDDGVPWHFVFSRGGRVAEEDWIPVAADEQVAIEAVGALRFDLETNSGTSARPGDALTVNPRLYTSDGLLINLSCRGANMGSFDRERSHNKCHLKLVGPDGEAIGMANSGFA